MRYRQARPGGSLELYASLHDIEPPARELGMRVLPAVRDPKLEGRVIVKFVVNREGRVESPSLVESTGTNKSRNDTEVTTLHDARVTSCALEGFRGLVFPKPEGGVLTVVYPIIFGPSD